MVIDYHLSLSSIVIYLPVYLSIYTYLYGWIVQCRQPSPSFRPPSRRCGWVGGLGLINALACVRAWAVLPVRCCNTLSPRCGWVGWWVGWLGFG